MAHHILSQSIYAPQDRDSRETIIEDVPQVCTLPATGYGPQGDHFDDLYDISEGEEDMIDIPIAISVSNSPVHPRNGKSRPPLVIPDLSSWPSVHKSQETQPFDRNMLSPPVATPKSQLSQLAKRSSFHSTSSNTPSLDESMTSDDLSNLSCPSTPALALREENAREWDAPVQLNPKSLMTLDRLTIPTRSSQSQLFALQTTEMTETGSSLDEMSIAMTPVESGELSALSVPSPGGFFSNLDSATRHAWQPDPVEPPLPTSVAEQFYGVPFGSSDDASQSPLPPLPRSARFIADDTTNTEGPPTARHVPAHWTCGTPGLQALKSPDFFAELHEYNEKYERNLNTQSTANLDRTSTWIQDQGCFPLESDDIMSEQPNLVGDLPSTQKEISPKDDSLLQGFEQLHLSKKPADVFVHRKTRTEKLRLDRKCLFNAHISQLEGRYGTPTSGSIASPMWTGQSLNSIAEETSEEAVAIANTVNRQKVLDQISPVSWNVEATKFLNGGTLLTSPTAKLFNTKKDIRILDLGGVASCDWSWQVALEYQNATVHSVCTADQPIDDNIAMPRNHKQTVVPNLWTLPFPDNYFDCISARNLYAQLKLIRHRPNMLAHTQPTLRSKPLPGLDEYDLCLKECLRVLRPGAFLEFALLDAETVDCGRVGRALNANFTRKLDERGYDYAPTRAWLPRLRKVGFGQIRRAWLILPMTRHAAAGSGANGAASDAGMTADASHITGMVGSWAWERWLLKLQKELKAEELHLLDGVSAAMDEGARTGASWRYLSGWARKP